MATSWLLLLSPGGAAGPAGCLGTWGSRSCRLPWNVGQPVLPAALKQIESWDFLPRPDISNAVLVAGHDDFRVTANGRGILAAGARRFAGSVAGKQDLAGAIGPNRTGHASQHPH